MKHPSRRAALLCFSLLAALLLSACGDSVSQEENALAALGCNFSKTETDRDLDYSDGDFYETVHYQILLDCTRFDSTLRRLDPDDLKTDDLRHNVEALGKLVHAFDAYIAAQTGYGEEERTKVSLARQFREKADKNLTSLKEVLELLERRDNLSRGVEDEISSLREELSGLGVQVRPIAEFAEDGFLSPFDEEEVLPKAREIVPVLGKYILAVASYLFLERDGLDEETGERAIRNIVGLELTNLLLWRFGPGLELLRNQTALADRGIKLNYYHESLSLIPDPVGKEEEYLSFVLGSTAIAWDLDALENSEDLHLARIREHLNDRAGMYEADAHPFKDYLGRLWPEVEAEQSMYKELSEAVSDDLSKESLMHWMVAHSLADLDEKRRNAEHLLNENGFPIETADYALRLPESTSQRFSILKNWYLVASLELKYANFAKRHDLPLPDGLKLSALERRIESIKKAKPSGAPGEGAQDPANFGRDPHPLRRRIENPEKPKPRFNPFEKSTYALIN